MEDRILIADDEDHIRNILYKLLTKEGYEVQSVANGGKILSAINSFQPHVLLLDQCMPEMDGIEILKKVKDYYPETMVIMITAYGAVDKAVDAIKLGAYDYIEKPFDNDKLVALINKAGNHSKLLIENKQLKQQISGKYDFSNIIGVSDKMHYVFDQVRSVCATDASVLILGESGVGKELIAKSIHYNSNRQKHPFISVNCGAIPLELMESELFGHERGAFTDAKETKKGRFEQAHNGSLFLDEIGELKMDAQVKLLRVLEDKKVSRLGGKKSIPVDVRIISATNCDLEEKINQNQFRLDLYYRLNIFTIRIPPLRERPEDMPSLIGHFIGKYNKSLGLEIENVSQEAMEILAHYEWPGNIRDLENAIQSAMIMAREGTIQKDHLPIRCKGYSGSKKVEYETTSDLATRSSAINNQAEKEMLIDALEKCDYKRSDTAHYLKISRKTLYNKMKKHGLLKGSAF